MRKIILMALLLAALAGASEAAHVRSYTRKDGTHVSGYSSGADRGVFGGDKENDPIILGIIVVIGVVVLIVWAIGKAVSGGKEKATDPNRIQMIADEAKRWLERIESGQFVSPDTPLVLRENEVALLHRATSLMEAKATRFYGGMGTRIKGIYVGGGASRPVDTLSQIDSGTLTLTSQRLVFDGQMQNRTAEVQQIVSLKPYADAIEVASSKRQKSQVYLVDNPILWQTAIKLVTAGGFTVRKKEVPRPVNKPIASPDVKFACQKCGQHLVVDKAAACREVRCTNCGAELTVPVG